MKRLGTILTVLGAALLVVAFLSLFGTRLREAGIDIVADVTSFPYTVLVGMILALGGLWLRRRATRQASVARDR